MNDFDYEVLQKKRTASGARHRKNGSKSKKCTLPSDHLTEAQKRKLNGPVYKVNMDQPLDWDGLMALPDTLKKEYLLGLIKNYGASQRMLADMLGRSQFSVRKELTRLEVKSGSPGGRAGQGAEYERRKAMWSAFCNGVVGGGNSIISEANDQIEAQDERIEEPHVWDLDSPDHVNAYRVEAPEAEAVARAQERLESIEAQGVSLHSEDWDTAGIERQEPECGETEAEEAKEPKEPKPRINLTALAAKYEDDADAVYAQIGELMQLFSGAKVKVKLSVEVC